MRRNWSPRSFRIDDDAWTWFGDRCAFVQPEALNVTIPEDGSQDMIQLMSRTVPGQVALADATAGRGHRAG